MGDCQVFFSVRGCRQRISSSTILLISPNFTLLTCNAFTTHAGFPGSWTGEESVCNTRGPGLIPRLGRSPGEGIGYLLQYFWAALVAQMVKNLTAVWETWVLSLCWEDPLEKGKAIHSSILAWIIPWTEEPGRLKSMGSQRVWHDWVTFIFLSLTAYANDTVLIQWVAITKYHRLDVL